MLLGYPQNTSNIPLNTQLDGFVRYASGYAQDDWRVTNKLTINYGVRIEHESGLQERSNQFAVNFDQNAVNPLNTNATVIDPVTGARRQIMGGLVFAGQNGAPTSQGDQPALKAAPRAGAVYSLDDKTVIRGGWGLYYSPWNFPAAGTNAWGQTGYSSQTNVPQVSSGVPTVSLSNPFPAGVVQPSGNTLGLLTGTGGDIFFVDPNRGAPRCSDSADFQRELPRFEHQPRLHGPDWRQPSWAGSNADRRRIHQHQPARSEVSEPAGRLHARQRGEPALRRRRRGPIRRPDDDRARTVAAAVPEFGNVYMEMSTGAHSQYNAGIFQLRKRVTGL
jgi:hypothetical protein